MGQILTSPSLLPVAMTSPTGGKATLQTSPRCPRKVRLRVPFSKSQSRAEWSQLLVASNEPSRLKLIEDITPSWKSPSVPLGSMETSFPLRTSQSPMANPASVGFAFRARMINLPSGEYLILFAPNRRSGDSSRMTGGTLSFKGQRVTPSLPSVARELPSGEKARDPKAPGRSCSLFHVVVLLY